MGICDLVLRRSLAGLAGTLSHCGDWVAMAEMSPIKAFPQSSQHNQPVM
jgi:hypothetical protein